MQESMNRESLLLFSGHLSQGEWLTLFWRPRSPAELRRGSRLPIRPMENILPDDGSWGFPGRGHCLVTYVFWITLTWDTYTDTHTHTCTGVCVRNRRHVAFGGPVWEVGLSPHFTDDGTGSGGSERLRSLPKSHACWVSSGTGLRLNLPGPRS